jgi:hypothetical protein
MIQKIFIVILVTTFIIIIFFQDYIINNLFDYLNDNIPIIDNKKISNLVNNNLNNIKNFNSITLDDIDYNANKVKEVRDQNIDDKNVKVYNKNDGKKGEEEYEDEDEVYDEDGNIEEIYDEEYFTNNNFKLDKTDTPKNIWTYWENTNGRKYPPTHIQLCLESMKLHLGKKYNLVILNEKTIQNYLPDIKDNVKENLNKLLIAQKVDYYRVALLHKYGGIWIDADTIVMRDFDEIFHKLDEYVDFVGFGCTGMKCNNGYPKPSNGVMGSRINGILMNKCLEKLDNKLQKKDINYKYFDLGKINIWEALEDLKSINYDYYHFPSEYDGTRDKNHEWVHSPNHFDTARTDLLDINKAFFIMLANYEIANVQEYNWINDCDKEKLLNGPYWISTLFRKSFNKS